MTKDQEREALKKIMKIINALPEESYVKKAAEGLEETAMENIENDSLESWKERYLYHIERTGKEDRKAREAAEATAKQRESERDYWKSKCERLEVRGEEMQERITERGIAWSEMLTERNAALEEIKGLQNEITTLKAKLYDMITAAA